MKWNEILIFWVYTQIGSWLSYFILDTSLKITTCGMFFTGTFAIVLAVIAKVKHEA